MTPKRLKYDDLSVTPVTGEFDPRVARSFLERRPEVLPDPHGGDVYAVLDTPAVADLYYEEWLAGHRPAYKASIHVDPRHIGILQEFGSHHGPAMVAFIQWLLGRYDCRVEQQGYADFTDQIREHGIAAFYDPEDARDDAPWRHHLIGVGFYVELLEERGVWPHRHLAHAIADTPQECEAELAAYLRAGVRFRDFLPDTCDPDYDPAEPLRDVLDPSGDATIEAPRALLTDGVYVWGADLAYYVERYHARLPRAFWHHAHERGWRIPADLDVSRLTLATDGLP